MKTRTGSRSGSGCFRRKIICMAIVACTPLGCALEPQTTIITAETPSATGPQRADQAVNPDLSAISAAAAELSKAYEAKPSPSVMKPGGPRHSSGLIWDRVRAGFVLPDSSERPQVVALLRKHQSNPSFLEHMTERAEPYMHFIVEEIERRGMPLELALLPAVESAFQTAAYSSSHAAGLWQFLPSTGKDYGLKQSWWYDGRRDIYDSTRAALDYLEFLNAQFGGDWLLTLAAYNAGPATITRAMEKNRKHGKPTDYWSLQLPPETERYLPKLLAMKAVVEAPKEHGVDLCPIPDEPYFAAVEVSSQFDLDVAAGLADLTPTILRELNPGFKRAASDPQGPHRLLVPKEKAEMFKTRLASVAAEDMLRARHHRVARGETLNSIARRYDVSVADLRGSNHLSNSQRLRTGQLLLVPTPEEAAEETPATVASSVASTAPQKASARIMHTVARGETFWRIARSYGVDVKLLAKWNHRSVSKSLKIGERLVVYRTQGAAGKKVASSS